MKTVRLNLSKRFFGESEFVLLQAENLSATAFRYKSGVCAVKIKNLNGEMIILPFKGQQIWSANFCGKELVMKSTFPEPVETSDYLSTYGGFMLHCGLTAMGVPGREDTNPLHGELPNIPYDNAYVEIGSDGGGNYIAVGGAVNYRVAFNVNYIFEPQVKLYEQETVADISMKVTNLRQKPMEYMYLCHINYRPFDGSQLVYSAVPDPAHVKVHKDIPANMPADKAARLREYMDKIQEDPRLHNVIDSSCQIYDPEIVFAIDYNADEAGYAHCMQVMPEGDAYYVAFRPEQLPCGVRWIARTIDEDALGMVLPATGEHKGYVYAKEKGQVKTIPAGRSITINVKAGYLKKEQADKVSQIVKRLV